MSVILLEIFRKFSNNNSYMSTFDRDISRLAVIDGPTRHGIV